MPTSEKVLNLIKYIVCYATDHDIKLTTIQLVKYLYLADLYHARYHDGETITHFPWAFIYYGPYCSEAWQSIEDASSIGVISKLTYESRFSDKDFNLFVCRDINYEELKRMFPKVVTSELQGVIKKYDNDTAQLLDYVYFETEPMTNVNKGDLLDFARAKKPRLDYSVNTPNLSKDDINKIKYHASRLGDRFKSAREKNLEDRKKLDKFKDDIYYNALKYFDGDPLPTDISGIIKIET